MAPATTHASRFLDGLAPLLDAPTPELPALLSALVADAIPHSTLVMVGAEVDGERIDTHGDASIAALIAPDEIAALRRGLRAGTTSRTRARVAGSEHPVLTSHADTGGTLVLVDVGASDADRALLAAWQVLSRRLAQHADEATPSYLLESRAASRVRMEVATELTDVYSGALESLLTVLRSKALPDAVARQRALEVATTALVRLRTTTDRVRTSNEEPVTSAFERLRDDLGPLVRYRHVEVQFVEPPVDGRALPSEVAHGARAVVRGAILAAVDQPGTGRVRVQWDCDGENLLIDLRDDGPGDLVAQRAALQPIRRRVLALNGRMSLSATEGWGSEITVVMPLDPPPTHGDEATLDALGHRELQVLDLLASGMRNRAIAGELRISENTVKFHVSNILHKLGVQSRSEAASLVLAGRFASSATRQRVLP